jgi:hypothetical protein
MTLSSATLSVPPLASVFLCATFRFQFWTHCRRARNIAVTRRIGPGQLMTLFTRFATAGQLDRKGLRKIVKELGAVATQAELNAVMWDLDEDGNGKISPKEFAGRLKLHKSDAFAQGAQIKRKAVIQHWSDEDLSALKKKLKAVEYGRTIRNHRLFFSLHLVCQVLSPASALKALLGCPSQLDFVRKLYLTTSCPVVMIAAGADPRKLFRRYDTDRGKLLTEAQTHVCGNEKVSIQSNQRVGCVPYVPTRHPTAQTAPVMQNEMNSARPTCSLKNQSRMKGDLNLNIIIAARIPS